MCCWTFEHLINEPSWANVFHIESEGWAAQERKREDKRTPSLGWPCGFDAIIYQSHEPGGYNNATTKKNSFVSFMAHFPQDGKYDLLGNIGMRMQDFIVGDP
jgi:hypothetical protein